MQDLIFVDKVENLADGEMKKYEVNQQPVLLVRVGDNFFAVGAICTHGYAELCEGFLEGYNIVCPLHFASFDVRNGEVVDPPATEALPVYSVVIEDGNIWIKKQPNGGE